MRYLQTSCARVLGVLLAAILTPMFSGGLTAQEPPKPILVDEFERVTCEELLARTDVFFAEMMQNPSDIGYAVISVAGRDPKGYKRLISASVAQRGIDSEKIKVVLNSGPAKPGVQLWRVPIGSAPPVYTEVAEPPLDVSKPFIFGYSDESGVCPSFVPKLYANLIKENPGSQGKIIVRGNSWSSRKSLAEDYITDLRTTFGLSKKQLRVFYIHRPRNFLTEAEFWFIPAKKK